MRAEGVCNFWPCKEFEFTYQTKGPRSSNSYQRGFIKVWWKSFQMLFEKIFIRENVCTNVGTEKPIIPWIHWTMRVLIFMKSHIYHMHKIAWLDFHLGLIERGSRYQETCYSCDLMFRNVPKGWNGCRNLILLRLNVSKCSKGMEWLQRTNWPMEQKPVHYVL